MTRSRVKNDFSTGIDDGADANAITINSSEQVGINNTSPAYALDVGSTTDAIIRLRTSGTGSSDDTFLRMQVGSSDADNWVYFGDADDSNAGQVGYQHSSNRFRVFTNATEALRINSDQSLQTYGGITFSGTATATNALDDYEEGTWTPTSSSNISAIANVSGNYTKIGNVVHVSFFADITPTSSSTQIRIGGLPYAVADKISGTSFEGTGVIFEDSSLYFFAAFGGSSDLWIEYDRPMQGSATTTNRSYRGSVVYYAA